jgi:antitoxin CptB
MDETDKFDALELRRRRLRFRAWHRGMREMDFIFGRFADAELARMDEHEIAELERLMEAPDPEFFAWITGQREVPAQFDTPMFRRLAAFHRSAGSAAAP